MSKGRTTISIDADVLQQAQERDINVSKTTERALVDALGSPQYHFVNTNKQGLPSGMDGTDCYNNGVTATYGDQSYGEQLSAIERGDIILSWVSDVGLRAVGHAIAEWDGRSVNKSDPRRIAPSRDAEYHVPTRWDAVLSERDCVDAPEFKRITGMKSVPPNARWTVSAERNPETLVDVIIGRAGRQQLADD